LSHSSNRDHVIVFGRLKYPYVKAKRVQVLGALRAVLVVADEEIVVLGSGRVNVLASNNCILLSGKRPLIVERAHCVNILVLGGRAPVVLKYVRARSIYARRAIMGEVEVEKAVLAELCSIETLSKASRIVFVDPHLYFENLGYLGEVMYTYKLPDRD